MQEKDLRGNGKNKKVGLFLPVSLVRKLRRVADRCGVEWHELIRIMIVELAEEEKRCLEEVGTPDRNTRLNLALPVETVAFLTQQAKARKIYPSQYVQELLLGCADPKEYHETESSGQSKVCFLLPDWQAERLRKLARAAHISRGQYIRNLLTDTPVNVPVYLNIDMDELEPLFLAMEDAAAGIQDLVLRPDRTEAERRESRRIQANLLEEIRRIRLQIEEWGDTKIGNTQASFAEGEGLRERSGLSDVSDE